MTTTAAIYETLDGIGTAPFSSGSAAMTWMAHNCDACIRSWCSRHPEVQPPAFSDTEKLAERGQECWGAFAIGVGFVSGLIPMEAAEWFGADIDAERNFASIPDQCPHFSDDDRDNPELAPTPNDPNQLRLPFLCAELFGFADPDVLVFDRVIISKHDLLPAIAGKSGVMRIF